MKKIMAAMAGIFLLAMLMMPMMAQAITNRETQNQLWASKPQAFSDIPAGHPNYNAIGMLSEDEVIKGYADGTFKPDGAINRAELTKMLVAWFAKGTDLTSYKNCFPDVKEEWFAPYICYAKSKGWVGGYPDGTFKPSNPVNRVEAIKIALSVMIPSTPVDYWPAPTDAEKQYPLPADAENGAWYTGYLAFAIAKELLDGQHVAGDQTAFYYKPAESMTRKEVAEMMYRVWLYMSERVEYVQIAQMAGCIQAAGTGKTDTELHAAWVAELAGINITENDANQLEAKYSTDDVMKEMLQYSIANSCPGGSNDVGKWEFILTKYAR